MSGYLTPPELAKRWRIKPDRVLVLIRSGELRAFDVASRGARRPRFRIPPDAIIEFENRRNGKVEQAPQRRRRKPTEEPGFVRYFS